ncbi:hepatocyte growth factor receptor-like [Mytilus trossulus]|uniref:hepatocyte growth factor receptor-like n=1 Tax=Mytilus trossulus TaxID=6551 RepID=UPI003004571C
MKKMAAIYRQLIVLSVTWTIVDSFTEPTPAVSNLTLSAQIWGDGTCNDVNCYRTHCVGRSSTGIPYYVIDMNTLDGVCKPLFVGPTNGYKTNGLINIDSTNYANCSVSETYSLSEYTLTFWINYDCTGTSVCSLSIRSDIKAVFKNNQMTVNGENYNWTSNTWKFVVIKKNSKRSVIYIDDKQKVANSQLPNLNQINIDSSNMNSGDYFRLVDVRLYNITLTDREITKIFNNLTNIEDVKPYSECRCPSLHPIVHFLVDDNYYSLQCKNEVGEMTSRFKQDSVIQYIVDNDTTTIWKTNMEETAFNIKLDQIYQIDEIELITKTIPCNVTFMLDSGNNQRLSGSMSTKWSDISQNINSRSQYEEVITRNISVLLSGFCTGNNGNSHDIAEILVTGRCSCYGNSGSCTYRSSSNKNVCQCENNTIGSDCSKCNVGYYRSEEDFGCHQSCLCNTAGFIGSTQNCSQVDGQCTCKSNVEGRQCDTCKHIHYNLIESNSAGCSRSQCDSNGTLRCNNNVTCDMCECKTNVEGMYCDRCKQYHYGINVLENGCAPCNCNTPGTQNAKQTCDLITGQCDCKTLVEGQQCNTCTNGTYGLENVKSSGCTSCGCNKYGSSSKNCHATTGQCTCQEENKNLHCDAEIENMMPSYGPMSGGTVVTLTGHLFGSFADSKEGLDIFMDARSSKLEILSWNQTTVIFKTDKSNSPKRTSFLLRWTAPYDMYGGTSEDMKLTRDFQYISDPVINKVNSMVSFESGGCDITIQGTSLNSVYQPKLISYMTGNDNITTNCRPVGLTTLVCESPQGTIGTSIKYGLILDGVTMYEDLSTNFPQAFFNITSDPTVQSKSFDDYKMLFSDNIIIQGTRLKEACEGSLKIMIGSINCKIESSTNERIECKPDLDFPGVSLDAAKVMVKIGNFNHAAGTIKLILFWDTIEFIGIAIGAGALVVLMLVIVICCCCCRRRKSKDCYSSTSKNPVQNGYDIPMYNAGSTSPSTTNLIQKEDVPSFPNRMYSEKRHLEQALSYDETDCSDDFLHKIESSVREKIEKSISDRQNIEPGKVCTLKGTEIRVLNGTFSKNSPNAGKELIIKTNVKTLKELMVDNKYPAWVNNGLLECMKFQDSFHDNIQRMLGISVDQNRFYEFYPAYSRGFKEYLNDAKHDFTVKQLLEMCLQVAQGMTYLSNENMVHKDLATRNCVVCADGLIKISDSSFSWNLYPTEYLYDQLRQRYLPVRWMALESLKMGYYDISSDVWSFGVLLWEVMTLSLYLPYHDQESDKVIKDHIDEGFRLGMPTNAPEDLYGLMVNCWEVDNHNRPSFDEIVEQLGSVMNPESQYINLNQSTAGKHNAAPPVPQRGGTVIRGQRS